MGVTDFSFSFFDDPAQIIASTIGTVFAVALCSGGGIGGGGILVPLYILLDGYDEHHAVPLSKVVIFGAAFTDFWLYRKLRHPTQKWRSLISYDLAVIMEPLILGGTIVGVVLNVILPELIVGIMLILLLTYTAFRMFKKAKEIKEKEKKTTKSKYNRISTTKSIQKLEDEQNELLNPVLNSSDADIEHAIGNGVVNGVGKKSVNGIESVDNGGGLHAVHNGKTNGNGVAKGKRPPQKMTLEASEVTEQYEGYPWGKNALLAFSWLSILAFALVKDLSVDCGSAAYWISTFAPFPVLLGITLYFGRVLLREHAERDVDSYAKGDIMWDQTNVIKYPVMSSIAGVAAALLGVGGGMVTGPLMLELGVIPEVSRVTSAYMILFTSSCTSMQYLILGRINLDEAVWYMAWGFVGAILGHNCVEYLLKKYNSTSVLVYILAWAVLCSGIAMGAVDIVDVVKNGWTGGSGIC